MAATLLAIALLVALPQGDASTAIASLEGYVRDAASHAPVPNAFVVLSSAAGDRKATVSDGDGRFAFTGLAPGRYSLAGVKEGFAFDPATGPVAVLTAGRAAAVDIAMTRAAVIAGEVRDEQGKPRSGIAVTVIRKPKTGGTEMPPLEPARTNDRGEFRVDLLPPGEYLVLASPPDKRTGDAAVMPTYYPSVTDQQSATTKGDGTFRITGLGSGSYRLTPLPAPEAPPQQLPPDVINAAVTGNRSTTQVDVHDASVNGVTIVLRGAVNQRTP